MLAFTTPMMESEIWLSEKASIFESADGLSSIVDSGSLSAVKEDIYDP